jgi:hypothetical protein
MSQNVIPLMIIFIGIPILLGISILVVRHYRRTYRNILAIGAVLLFVAGPLIYYGLVIAPDGDAGEVSSLRLEVTTFYVKDKKVCSIEYGFEEKLFNVTGITHDFNSTPVSTINYRGAKEGATVKFSFESNVRFVGNNTGTVILAGHDSIKLNFESTDGLTVEGSGAKRTVQTIGTDAEMKFTVGLSWLHKTT